MILAMAVGLLSACLAEGAVLDPALYLAPSPPLVLTSDSVPPGSMWERSVEARTERLARVVAPMVGNAEKMTKPVAGESRMFWPRFSSPQPALDVHIPLTFSLAGSYGKVAPAPSVIANTYTSVAGLGTRLGSGISSVGSGLTSGLFGKTAVANIYGRTALAGSSYGTYGTSAVRVYGSDNVASWSGWGNGKWGHYGKG